MNESKIIYEENTLYELDETCLSRKKQKPKYDNCSCKRNPCGYKPQERQRPKESR